MPIYEYACDSCGHHLEALQRLSEAPLIDCPACGESALRKKVSAAAFRLKGTGWYETDFKNDRKSASDAQNKGDDDGDTKKGPKEGSASDAPPKNKDSSSDSATTGGSSAADSGKGDSSKAADPSAKSGGGSTGATSPAD
ncbi:MAG: zinc ribbon domain-containing protein [Pseudomonadota bacterium]|nr:zinc ribbon domain-containing protein [Pseudomonadota bacterium]